jgi:type III pantothenate kinase
MSVSKETERSLLLDLGNTRMKWVWAVDGALIESSFGRGGLGDFQERCKPPDGGMPGRILLSSVASRKLTARVSATCERLFGLAARPLQSQPFLAGIKNGYERPAELGVDRWLAIVGAVSVYGQPLVVADLGTATTLDAVDGQGRHLGGMILPGPALMLEALGSATSMQVPADMEREGGQRDDSAGVGPGRSTSAAITQGVRAAQIGAMNQFMRHVSERLNAKPKFVITGGAAKGIMNGLKGVAVFDPWLVFRGMLQVR